MNEVWIIQRLEALREQEYPLVVDEETAIALVVCIRRIIDAVPDDDRVFVRSDYDLATSALRHPSQSDF